MGAFCSGRTFGCLLYRFFFRDPDRAVPCVEGAVVSPADGKVLSVDSAQDSVFYKGPYGLGVCTVQIAGLIARRIICHVGEGENVRRGQRFGLICFGSRLDVYLPPETKIQVAAGDKTRAGTTILGYLP